MKKFLALALVCIMTLGLMGSALADDDVTTLKVLVRTGDIKAGGSGHQSQAGIYWSGILRLSGLREQYAAHLG